MRLMTEVAQHRLISRLVYITLTLIIRKRLALGRYRSLWQPPLAPDPACQQTSSTHLSHAAGSQPHARAILVVTRVQHFSDVVDGWEIRHTRDKQWLTLDSSSHISAILLPSSIQISSTEKLNSYPLAIVIRYLPRTMRVRHSLQYLCGVAAALSGASAQSYNTIPEIEVYGQHFFYSNNGSQLHV